MTPLKDDWRFTSGGIESCQDRARNSLRLVNRQARGLMLAEPALRAPRPTQDSYGTMALEGARERGGSRRRGLGLRCGCRAHSILDDVVHVGVVRAGFASPDFC